MNLKIKALVIAAIATITMSQTANALVSDDLFLVVYNDDATFDVDGNETADLRNTYVRSLGKVSTFTDANATFNLATDTNWTSFKNNDTGGTTTWSIIGVKGTSAATANTYQAGDLFAFTQNPEGSFPGNMSNATFNTITQELYGSGGQIKGWLSAWSAVSAVGTSGTFDGAGYKSGNTVGSDVFSYASSVFSTSQYGENASFYIAGRPTNSNFGTGFSADTASIAPTLKSGVWSLASTGSLTYTVAAVPESETSSMILAGLGLMGFIARRRKLNK